MSSSTAQFDSAEAALIGNIYTSKTLWPTLRTLCDDCNGRFVGSDDERRAAAFIADTLRAYGLSDVHTEAFDIHGWQRGPAHLLVNKHDLGCIGLPGTPSCKVTAPVINLGAGEPNDFARAGKAAKGKLALVRNAGSHRLEKYFRAVQAGCVGFIFAGADAGCLPLTGSIEFGGKPAPLPGVGISYEAGAQLERLAARGEVNAQLQVQAKLSPAQGLNVIADIPATGRGDVLHLAGGVHLPYLLLCAHYDGHDIAQGAVDNASGTVAVLEAARALMQVREQLNIGVRVALWSGEEMGMLGSNAYALQHKAELKRVKFVFNCDIVSNPGLLWMGINGVDTERLPTFFKQLASENVHELQMTGNEVIVPYSDHFSFYLKGVPALMAATPHAKQPHLGPHTHADTLDKVDMQALRNSTAFVARALLHLAHNPSPLPTRHATKQEVQTALRGAGYEKLLKAQGRWKF